MNSALATACEKAAGCRGANARRRHLIPVLVLTVAASLAPFGARGAQFTYISAHACASQGKIGAPLCDNAEANAAAEFSEKAPRFGTREACEIAFGRGRCSLLLEGAGGWAGKKAGVEFTPRQEGFRVTVVTDKLMTVVPIAAGIAFSPRSILHRDIKIDHRFAQHGQSAGKWAVGASPPLVRQDPNFDCSALLEPSTEKDPMNPGCYPAPPLR
jgi:hypothetical protein